MRKRKCALALSIVVAVACAATGTVRAQAGTEEAAVRQAVEAYFEALKNRDVEALKKVIHANTIFASVTREGKLDEMTMERWHGLIRPTEQNSAKYEMTGSIQSVDVTDNTASVKSTVEFPRYVFHEYIALLKVEGRWMIVNKIFILRGKPRP